MEAGSSNVASYSHPYARSKTSNSLFLTPGIDGRSRTARRYRDLVRALVDQLGGIKEIKDAQLVEVRRAADLVVAGEALRARSLGGEPVDVLALVRLENLARRAVRALGVQRELREKREDRERRLRKPRKPTPDGPGLGQYLAAKAGG